MVKLNKIYTRTGDDGTTGLVDGSRVSKADPRMAAIGDVDEANSAIGLAVIAIGTPAAGALTRIQNDLFDLGADLAVPEREGKAERLRVPLPAPAETGIVVLGEGAAARLLVGLADGRVAVVAPDGGKP